jgi:N-acetylmuramoyl-L-alanine amidase
LGETVELVETVDGWSRVTVNGQEGWLPRNQLRRPGQYLIVIDPGHQRKGNSAKEPIGPGSSVLKAKVATGARGVSTKLYEFKLTLEVGLKLRDVLLARGYEVVMIRTTHTVNISNAERALMANELYADAFIRIHANGSSDRTTSGIMTLCQTADNPWNAEYYSLSYKLSKLVRDEMVKATGAKKLSIKRTDTMSGINWCQVPVTIVEMGFLSNPEEDRLMSTAAYQDKLVAGMAAGLGKFFGK